MKFSFIGQPLGPKRAGDWLQANLEMTSWSEFRAAVAFAKFSGVKHIRNSLAGFCERAKATLSIGIDHRGTSKEALNELLLAMSSQSIYIVHHSGAITYHPKIYLFANNNTASALIGSVNLTEGGLFTNYEASFLIEMTLSDLSDKELFEQINGNLDSWSNSQSPIVRKLDETLLSKLVTLGLVPTEAQLVEESKKNFSKVQVDENALANKEVIFGSISIPLAPSVQLAPSKSATAASADVISTLKPTLSPLASKGQLRWRKADLKKSDAARPSAGSSTTANLRLSQAGFSASNGQLINWQKYFRNDVFGHLAWKQGQNNNVETTAKFRIFVNDKFLGTHSLRVSHNPKREEGQSNVTTVLHWGSARAAVYAANIVGKKLELFGPDAAGQFTIDIS